LCLTGAGSFDPGALTLAFPTSWERGENDKVFISSVGEDAAEGDLAEYYRSQRAAWGFLPKYAAAFSTRPDVARHGRQAIRSAAGTG